MHKKTLVTGGNGFTGRYLVDLLKQKGHEVHKLQSNLLDKDSLKSEIKKIQPKNIIHLAGISFTQHHDIELFYKVHLIGTINLLQCIKTSQSLDSLLIASSGAMYKNNDLEMYDEDCELNPGNHYGLSKFSMEKAAAFFKDEIPLIIARPFNYTGNGQDPVNLIPKIVNAFKALQPEIHLGNTNSIREFNDVRFVVDCYISLIENLKSYKKPINICSGSGTSINEVIKICSNISAHNINVKVDKSLIRKNEPKKIIGNPNLLKNLITLPKEIPIEDTLRWMLTA